jgi:hypothetical protein
MLATVSYARLQRQNCVVGEDVEKLKQRLSLLDYLQQQHWVARPAAHGPEFVGLCLSLAKMVSGTNPFEISDIQEAETEGALTGRSGCNNVALR